jgi:hypothetical protein
MRMLPGEEWLGVRLAVAGEESDGVGGASMVRGLLFSVRGAPEAPVEDQEMTAQQLAA